MFILFFSYVSGDPTGCDKRGGLERDSKVDLESLTNNRKEQMFGIAHLQVNQGEDRGKGVVGDCQQCRVSKLSDIVFTFGSNNCPQCRASLK